MTLVATPTALRATRTTSAVSILGLSKRFRVRRPLAAAVRAPLGRESRLVLANIDLDVHEGEFVGLLGPNGAGKTTLFKVLSTLILPDTGRATVLGHDVVRSPATTRRLLAPVIADERSLHWRLTAVENLKLFSALHAVPRRDVDVRVRELLALVGLEATATQLVGTFSSGMKQRLLIARALLARPRVLLLDEPTRSLDPISARALRTFLRDELVGRQGCTVILATHSADEAFGLCDRVAVLDRGRLLATGPVERLARDVGDARFRAWTRDAQHPAWQALGDRGVVAHLSGAVQEDEWTRIDVDVPGGLDQAAHVLDLLTCAGVRVARFERAPLTLAELLDRIVTRRKEALDA
jgi:ABC-2 type transport system ATP-binding protein